MNPLGFVAVGMGAAFGAWLRWGLSLGLNHLSMSVPMGTLVANLGGGFMIGGALAFFSTHGDLNPAWRLLLVTGFLGGLTTFSTFSAESLTLLQRGAVMLALGHSALHLLGSLGCCALGYGLYQKVFG